LSEVHEPRASVLECGGPPPPFTDQGAQIFFQAGEGAFKGVVVVPAREIGDVILRASSAKSSIQTFSGFGFSFSKGLVVMPCHLRGVFLKGV
jgi:hypothetical protein